jgi:hypothetical protein
MANEPCGDRCRTHQTMSFKDKFARAEVVSVMVIESDNKLIRALELVGPIDPEIEESWSSIEERILAQALENVELAEQRLRAIQELVGERVLAEA